MTQLIDQITHKTNNMKLYTEEQVKDMFSGVMLEHMIDEFLNKNYTPIELPSDEEIRVQAVMYSNKWEEYRAGAKWMKEQILKQNK